MGFALIDGHNRYRICKENNIEFTVKEKHFNTRYEVTNWIIDNQLNRRSLNDNERAYLMGKKQKEEKKEHGKSRESIKSQIKAINSRVKPHSEASPVDKSTALKIAEEYNVSEKTVKNAEKYANAVDTIVTNTGVNPFQLITGDMKASREEIKELAKKPVEKQKEIIERVE